jgi:hypothetical protein
MEPATVAGTVAAGSFIERIYHLGNYFATNLFIIACLPFIALMITFLPDEATKH